MPQPAEVVAVDDVEYSQKSMSCILISVVQDLPGTCRVMSNHLYSPAMPSILVTYLRQLIRQQYMHAKDALLRH